MRNSRLVHGENNLEMYYWVVSWSSCVDFTRKELAVAHGNDEQFGLKMLHLSALAFFPDEEIPEAFNEFKPHLPEKARAVTAWLLGHCVCGRLIRKALLLW